MSIGIISREKDNGYYDKHYDMLLSVWHSNSTTQTEGEYAIKPINIVSVLFTRYPKIISNIKSIDILMETNTSNEDAINFIHFLFSKYIQPQFREISNLIVTELMQNKNEYLLKNTQNNITQYLDSELTVTGYIRLNAKHSNLMPNDLIFVCLTFYHDPVPVLSQLCLNSNLSIKLKNIQKLNNLQCLHFSSQKAIVASGVVPKLIEYLKCDNKEIQYYSASILFKITYQNPECIRYTLQNDILTNLLSICLTDYIGTNKYNLMLQRVTTALFCNFCCFKEEIYFFEKFHSQIEELVDKLNEMLSCRDKQIRLNIYHAFSGLTTPKIKYLRHLYVIHLMADKGIINKLISFLNQKFIPYPLINTISNILCGPDRHKQIALDCDILTKLHKIIQMNISQKTKAKICRSISNICTNESILYLSNIEFMIQQNMFISLYKVIQNNELEVINEALFCIKRVTSSCNRQHIMYLINSGALSLLFNLLKSVPYNINIRKLGKIIIINAMQCIQDILYFLPKINNDNVYSQYIQIVQHLILKINCNNNGLQIITKEQDIQWTALRILKYLKTRYNDNQN